MIYDRALPRQTTQSSICHRGGSTVVKRFFAIFAVALMSCCGCTRVAFAGQFRFQDLEYYYLHDYLPLASDDPEQAQLNNYAVQYTEVHFPLGSSASATVSALTVAGVKSSVDDDSDDPPGFVCDGQGRIMGWTVFVAKSTG